MTEFHSSCIKVSDTHICPFCYSPKIVKNGHTKIHKQQYFCKNCLKRFLNYYTYNACYSNFNENIIAYTKEGMGVRSIARILKISTTTFLRRYLQIVDSIKAPAISYNQEYEVDEMRFYIRKKTNPMWLVCALEKSKRQIISFYVGRRNNTTLNAVVKTLLFSNATTIHTDKLLNYKSLIPNPIHSTKIFGTNHIERFHLNIRTHIKRLSRRTICFSRSITILVAILKIYFWAGF